MESTAGSGGGRSRFFMYALLALFIAGLVVYISMYFRRSCRTTPTVENYYGFAQAMGTQITSLDGATATATATATGPTVPMASATPEQVTAALAQATEKVGELGMPPAPTPQSMSVAPMNGNYKNANGYIGEGGDLPESGPMTVKEAMAACDANPKCVAFTFNSPEPIPTEPVYILLKTITDFGADAGWQTYFRGDVSHEAASSQVMVEENVEKAAAEEPVPDIFGMESEATAGFQNFGGSYSAVEGFYAGPAVGAGMPDCMRSSADASKLYALLKVRKTRTEEGPDDLRELRLILSKVTCLKRDLLGNAGLVEATRYQPFSTAHDLEPVAETAARCFAKTIPQRDLALSLNKWGSRGTFLLKRLCTSYGLADSEEEEALALFGRVMGDITEIANSVCCEGAGPAIIAGKNQPRMIGGYEPPVVGALREYKGYY